MKTEPRKLCSDVCDSASGKFIKPSITTKSIGCTKGGSAGMSARTKISARLTKINKAVAFFWLAKRRNIKAPGSNTTAATNPGKALSSVIWISAPPKRFKKGKANGRHKLAAVSNKSP